MTQDTKYLDAYIKSNFNLKKMHNEFADKKDLDELNSWLNSDKYKIEPELLNMGLKLSQNIQIKCAK